MNMTRSITTSMLASLASYNHNTTGGYDRVTATWDGLQADRRCCGVFGDEDWGPGRVPASCRHFTTGCLAAVEPAVIFKVDVIAYCLIAIVVLEFCLVVISCRSGSFVNKLGSDGVPVAVAEQDVEHNSDKRRTSDTTEVAKDGTPTET